MKTKIFVYLIDFLCQNNFFLKMFKTFKDLGLLVVYAQSSRLKKKTIKLQVLKNLVKVISFC